MQGWLNMKIDQCNILLEQNKGEKNPHDHLN